MNKFQLASLLCGFAIIFSACAKPDQKVVDTTEQDRVVNEVMVYSLLLKDECKSYYLDTPVLILTETYYSEFTDDESILGYVPLMNKETLDDYRAVNQEEKQITSKLVVENNTCQLISTDEITSFLAEDINWYNKHMVISYSGIGFSEDLDQAFLYREYNCGGECAGGDLYFLVREGDMWKIQDIVSGFRS